MSKLHNRVTKSLLEVGACWAVRSDKYCDANDPYEDQLAGVKTYHVHPDQSYPHQDHIIRFRSLKEILAWTKAVKACNENESEAPEIMEDFWAEREGW